MLCEAKFFLFDSGQFIKLVYGLPIYMVVVFDNNALLDEGIVK